MQADPFPLMIYSTGTAIGETNATFIKPNDLICRLKVAANLRRAWQRFFYRKFSKTDHCVSLFRVQPEWGRRRQHQNFFTAWKCPQQLFLVSTSSFCCSVLLQHTHCPPALPCPARPPPRSVCNSLAWVRVRGNGTDFFRCLNCLRLFFTHLSSCLGFKPSNLATLTWALFYITLRICCYEIF